MSSRLLLAEEEAEEGLNAAQRIREEIEGAVRRNLAAGAPAAGGVSQRGGLLGRTLRRMMPRASNGGQQTSARQSEGSPATSDAGLGDTPLGSPQAASQPDTPPEEAPLLAAATMPAPRTDHAMDMSFMDQPVNSLSICEV